MTHGDRFLDELNEALAGLAPPSVPEGEPHPSVFVFGVPRSGTTVATQLLVAHTEMAYVNHVAAAFWTAPVHGILLSRKLFGDARGTRFTSRYGYAEDPLEPHEFGRFWDRLFGYADRVVPRATSDVDWPRVRETLLSMSAAFAAPAFYKSFHVGWQLDTFHRHFERALYVHVRRDPRDSAASLLAMRRAVAGSERAWTSFRPSGYEDLGDDPHAQVAGQVVRLGALLDANLSMPDPSAIVDVSYDSLCADPTAFVAEVVSRVRALGGDASVIGEATPLDPGPGAAALAPEDRMRLESALKVATG